ncbi:MAG: hypothetical protein N4A35_00915 [Flavobacteriales bacterium]|jgi:hypothetical protein|nr:hypothetical protein [Flavobacteriales bacterium]
MKMIKYSLFYMLLCLALGSLAQNTEGVKISSDVSSPNFSTMLEVVAPNENKGVLFPSVALTSIFDYSAVVGTATEGVLVYNTNASATGSCGQGYYYWNGFMWEKMDGNCIPKMTFSEMIALTSSLSSFDVGFQVFITDTDIPTENISGVNGCVPSTFNPYGVWQFVNVPQTHPKIQNCIQWVPHKSLPDFQCTYIGIQCP